MPEGSTELSKKQKEELVLLTIKVPQIEAPLICRGIRIYNDGVSHAFMCVLFKLLIIHCKFFSFPKPLDLA
jgi:hypothetical protein